MAQATRQELRARSRQKQTSGSRSSQRTAPGKAKPFNMPFENKNVIYVLIGIGVITLGYILMGSGGALDFIPLNISPFVLVLGYLVVVPLGIMYGTKKKKQAVEAMAQPSQTGSPS
ncbi:MAG TPA: hypothetical protein VEW28_11145 [Candidatus Kapabacteria bacterium]|nr:hypothetical protein [Candidatus Kapabacteria bacterium]